MKLGTAAGIDVPSAAIAIVEPGKGKPLVDEVVSKVSSLRLKGTAEEKAEEPKPAPKKAEEPAAEPKKEEAPKEEAPKKEKPKKKAAKKAQGEPAETPKEEA